MVVESSDSGVLVLPLIYYDFYRVESDDGERLAARDSLGLLTLSVAAGRQVIRIHERLTLISWLGIGIAAGSCMAGLVFLSRRRRELQHPAAASPDIALAASAGAG